MITKLGNFSLFLAWALSLVSIVSGFYGARLHKNAAIESARNSLLGVAVFSLLSLVCLGYDFLNHNYGNLYVWQHSSNDMLAQYLISAIWGGMDGSMLLWACIMSFFSACAIKRSEYVPKNISDYVVPVLAASTCFFISVVFFLTNPFRVVPNNYIAENGNGLNPLLQNPSMMIHPPMLYLGFTGFVIPFAYCIAALLSKELDSSWILAVRKWTLISWTFLTAGIVLGGNWAYIELGWGGFWAWDPVENASFMPWLTGTAFLHSVMVQEQRGMLKVWNIILATITYLLTVFGTFLTRSGVVQSVHAFAETDVGWVFLAYLAIAAVIVTVLIFLRKNELKPDNHFVSYLSRESAFLFNNIVLLGICFATFWGVMLPVFSEAITGEKLVVGPPFFNKVNNPLFLTLIFLMAVGPLISWRTTSISQIKKLFFKPFIAASLVSIFLMYVDPTRPLASIAFGLSIFVILSILTELYKSVAYRKSDDVSLLASTKKLLVSKKRKYAAHLIHIGVALCTISITASSAYKIERDVVIKKGETAEIGKYKVQLDEISQGRDFGYGFLRTTLTVKNAATDVFLTKLSPEKRIYTKSEEVTSEVDIYSNVLDDFYVALAGIEQPSSNGDDQIVVIFKFFVNPLQVWLWFSTILMLIGSMILIFDRSKRKIVKREQVHT